MMDLELCVMRDHCLQPLVLTVSSSVRFASLLQTLQTKLNESSLECFEYVDEDDDRITVRCDEDLRSLIEFYKSFVAPSGQEMMGSEFFDDGYPRMLKIYPRCGSLSAPPILTSPQLAPILPTPPLTVPSSSNVMSSDMDWIVPANQSFQPIQSCQLEPLGEIGAGFCGRVWRAKHVPTGRIIAVKTIDLDISSETAQQQILRELSVLKRCGDESATNIIKYNGAFFVDSAIHICTELMDAGSLERWLGRIPEPVLGRMIVQAVCGLCFIWSRKIMHRDVKPSNMLVSRDGHVKLCDFGVSIELERSIAKTFTGTYAYMSPERIQGEDYRIPSDVWSLGVSLFELAAGFLPFDSQSPTPIDVASKITQMRQPPLLPTISVNGLSLSAEIRDYVCGCMQRRPQDRLNADSDLLSHPFYVIHDTPDNRVVVGQWIRSQTNLPVS